MKIHFDNVNFNSTSGPNSFGYRLASCLKSQGHHIVLGDGHEADVSLIFIEPSGQYLAPKRVQRLDGIWFSPDEFKTKNDRIKTLYKNAHHVIWQSEFDRQMSTRWWNVPKHGTVIKNGIGKDFTKSHHVKEQLDSLRRRYEKVFVCSANWHPQKRLDTNVAFFEHIKQFYKSACLIVLGNNATIKKNPDIYVVGSQPHDVCMQVFQSSDWMIHLAWLDHCPNTVVEAIACGTPVVCPSDGGTKELVGNYGVVLKEEKAYDFELAYYDKPPSLDVTQWSGPLPERETLGVPPDLSIDNSARLYLDVFSDLLGEER